MTDPIAARIIDDLIVLFSAVLPAADFHCVDRGLDYIAQARRDHPGLPVTASLAPLIDQEPDHHALVHLPALLSHQLQPERYCAALLRLLQSFLRWHMIYERV